MQLPQSLLESLQGVNGFSHDAFEKVHSSGEQITSIRINPAKWKDPSTVLITGADKQALPAGDLNPVPWTKYGYYLSARPSFTFDPFFHAGCYYVQEASSMFIEHILRSSIDLSKPLRVLDCCAAPGGKSTHLISVLSGESLLVSNEIIRSRVNILRDNMIKWGAVNTVVTQDDPSHFTRLENFFDVIVVDAPCSGSGLFRRDEEAIGEWSENNVALCAQRQQRILSAVLPSLKKDGFLIYSTCSFSPQEDEDILRWLEKEQDMKICPVDRPAGWNITESEGGYRFWPYLAAGEGFFAACLQKTSGGESPNLKKTSRNITAASRAEMETASAFLGASDARLVMHQNRLLVWPAAIAAEMGFLSQHLHLVKAGLEAGELIRDKMIPAHALALSAWLKDDITSLELDYDQAIRYLQRKDMGLEPPRKGWQPVAYKGSRLGWINALPGRINNYYPPEMRILKDI